MASWIGTFPEEFGYRIAAHLGTCNTLNPDFQIPYGDISIEGLAIPSPLDSIVNNWADVFNYQLSPFLQFDSSDQLSFIPVSSWYTPYNLDSVEPYQVAYIERTNYPGVQIASNIQILDLLQSQYTLQEVAAPLTWQMINDRCIQIISSLSLYVTNSLAAGLPISASVTNVNNVCADPEGYWSSPEEALIYVRLGAEGVSLSLGQSWPPPMV